MHFMAVRKSKKRPGIVVYSYFKVLDRRADRTLINFVEYPPPPLPRSMLLVDNTLLPSAVTRKFLILCYYFAVLQLSGFNKN